MSKITKALEKAARERLLRERQQEPLVVTVPPVAAALPEQEKRIVVGDRVSHAVPGAVDPHIITYYNRNNTISEQYRMLRTQLQSLKASQGFSTLLLTSSFGNEGKTVTALNLALTLSQQPNCRVLLIDADLRKGAVSRWLGLPMKPGLSDVLTAGVHAQSLLVRLEASNLMLLPAGRTMPDPSDALNSERMRAMLHQFRRQFDFVLIDTAPVLLVTDPCVLSQQVDGVILVVRAGRTPRNALVQAQHKLDQVRAKTIGSIMTHMEYHNPLYERYYNYYKQEKHPEIGNGDGEPGAA